MFGSKGPKIDIEIRLSEILLEIKEMVGLASFCGGGLRLTGANLSDGEPTIGDNSNDCVLLLPEIAKEVSVKKLAVTIFLAVLLGFGLPGNGFSQSHSYAGKTINVVYGGGPGGTVDLRF